MSITAQFWPRRNAARKPTPLDEARPRQLSSLPCRVLCLPAAGSKSMLRCSKSCITGFRPYTVQKGRLCVRGRRLSFCRCAMVNSSVGCFLRAVWSSRRDAASCWAGGPSCASVRDSAWHIECCRPDFGQGSGSLSSLLDARSCIERAQLGSGNLAQIIWTGHAIIAGT